MLVDPASSAIASDARVATGVRPQEGGLHFGHYIGNLAPLLKFPESGEIFFVLSDALQYPLRPMVPHSKAVFDTLLDFLAFDLGDRKAHLVKQSVIHSQAGLLLSALLSLSTSRQLERIHPLRRTIRSASTFSLSDYLFPMYEALDLLCLDIDYLTSNIDNLGIVSYTRFLAKRFNNAVGIDVLRRVHLVHGRKERILGFDRRKMARKNHNYLILSASDEAIAAYVRKMLSFHNRVTGRSKSKISHNLVFNYLEALNFKDVEALKADYEAGACSEATAADALIHQLSTHFSPFREKRKELQESSSSVWDALEQGTEYAAGQARIVIERVEAALKR